MSTLLKRLEIYLKDDSSISSSNQSTSSLLPESLLEVVLKGGVWTYEEEEEEEKKRDTINNNNDDNDDNDNEWQNWSKLIDGLRNQILYDAIDAHRDMLADDEAFFELAKQLREVITMTYNIYIEKVTEAPITLQKYFKPSIFLMFPRNNNGAIVTEDFLRYIQRSIDVETVTLQLLKYAKTSRITPIISDNTKPSISMGSGSYMTEDELERYIFNLIPQLNSCRKLHEQFYPYYTFTAARRFLFFLDSRKTKRLNIKKLAHSSIMEEFLFLERITQYERDLTPESFSSQINNNWFSCHNALRIYNDFIQLDKDQNGMLSKDEFSLYSGSDGVQLTQTAINRIFEENITYGTGSVDTEGPEMDYKTFLDYVLAIENKSSQESLQYFWRVLDIDKTGRLSKEIITYFYRDIHDVLKSSNYDAPAVSNVIVEVFDILACNDHRGPTFQDLVKSGQGHTVISMLLDVNGFWSYDNRENLIQNSASSDEVNEQDGDVF